MKKILTHPLFKGSAIVFGGAMINNILAYAYHLVVGRILGPAQYGELAALISIFYILNAPSNVLQSVLVKFFSTLKAKNDMRQAKRLYVVVLKYSALMIGIVFIILIPCIPFIAGFLKVTTHAYIIWLYMIFALFVFGVINTSVFQAFQLFGKMTLIANIGSVARLIGGAVGAFFGVGWTLVASVASGLFTYGISLLPLKFLLTRKSKPLQLSTKDALIYSIPTLIAITAITAIYSQDVILVKHFFSPRAAGLYSSLSVLGKIIFFASSAICTVTFPILAERNALNRQYGKIVAVSLLGVGGISFGLTGIYYLFPDLVIHMLFGEAFGAASPLLAGFGLFISFFSLSYLLTMMYLALGKTRVWIIVAAAAILQIVLISMQHSTLVEVIGSNIAVSVGLFASLLLYYPYAIRQHS